VSGGASPLSPARLAPAGRGAILLVGTLLIAANLRPSITSVGPVLNVVRADENLSAATASALISIPLIAFALVSPAAPWLTRKVGMEWALALALVGLAVGNVIRSLPWSPGLWIGTALLGMAIAVLNVVLPSKVKRDHPDRVGQMTGAYSAVQAAVAAVAAGIAVPLADLAPSGWRLSLGVWAVLVIFPLAVLAPRLRRPPRPRPAEPDAAAPSPSALLHRSPWGSALAWQVTLFMGLQSTVFYILITWLPSIEQANGTSAATAGFDQLLLNAFGIAGSLGTAAVIHRLRDQRPIVVVASALVIVAILGVMFVPSLNWLWISISGVGAASSFVLALSLFGLRTVHHAQTAALSGMAQSVGYLLAASGPIVIGVVHDATGSWTVPLVIVIGLLAAQLPTGLLAGRHRVIG
jgi:CP family cyanate transporter-like MFS transporter